MSIAWFDMDGSLFDYEGHLRNSLKELASPDEQSHLDERDLHSLEDAFPYLKARMNLIKSVPGWWRSMPVLQNGFDVFKAAQSIGFDCRILTKGPKSQAQAWMEKVECCQHHFGNDIAVSIVSSKGETYGKVLYDDYPAYMEAWLKHRPRGLGIMPTTEYNKHFEHPNVVHYNGNNLQEVVNALQNAFNREAGKPLEH